MDEFKKFTGFEGEKIIVIPRNFLLDVSSLPLVNSLYLTDIGYFPNAKYHYRERSEGSEQYILIYCLKGEGFCIINGKNKKILENSLILIPKGTPHVYGADPKKPWTILWFHFDGKNAENYFNKSSSDHFILPVSIEKLSRIKFLFEDIFNCLERGYTFENIVYTSHILTHLMGLLFFMKHDYRLGLKEDSIKVEEYINFMKVQIEKRLSLNELAEQANLSPTHYSYLFKKKTGFSPVDYFTRLKIQQACKYLDMTELKVIEIANKLGFQDPYYFSRCFNKVMQQSPSAYREVKKG